MQKLNNGDLLIKTKNLKQITSFGFNINVEVTERAALSLNFPKGVIYSNALRNIVIQEMLNELNPQKITDL